MNINIRVLKDKVVKMLSAWLEGAPDTNFMEIKRVTMADLFAQAETIERQIEDLNVQKRMKEDELASVYIQLNDMRVDVGNGVRGDKNFGDDSALYGAMGFVRKSERRSGLTRKKKTTEK